MSYQLKVLRPQKATETRHVDLPAQQIYSRNYISIFAFLFSLVIGLSAAFYIMGAAALNPWNIDWLNGDPATHYLGWAFFRKNTEWFMPITWTNLLGYPWGVSISFLDSIPLIAVILRPFSALLGEPFQYIGIYAALCIILQAYFGFKIARLIGLNNFLSAMLAGMFFMLAPAFILRLNGHFALASHWIILAAIYCYLRDLQQDTPIRWLAPLWGLVSVAGAINPYIGVMCLLIALAASARLWLVKSISFKLALGTAAVSIGLLAISFVVFGFYIGGSSNSYIGGGYRQYSMNLLAIIDPYNYKSILLPAMPMAQASQYEGYNYLGLGIISFLVFGLFAKLVKGGDVLKRDAYPLMVVGVISTLIAASATITIGSFVIADIPLPRMLERVAQMLRASGRLFWPAYYLLFIAAIVSLRKIRSPILEIILAVGLVVQIADIVPLMKSVRETHARVATEKLLDPVWSRLGERHKHLGVYPTWHCNLATTPDGIEGFRTFGMLADNQNMTVNSYYAGRFGKQDYDRHCRQALESVMAGDLDPTTAYVLSDNLINVLSFKGIRTHHCSQVDGFNLCVLDSNNPGVMAKQNYDVGSWIDFSTAGASAAYLLTGWSDAEPWGRWSDGGMAKLALFPGKILATGLEIEAQAFVTEKDPSQTVNVFVNGHQVDRMEFTLENSQREVRIPLPPGLIQPNQGIELQFEIERPRSPLDVQLSADVRKLGIGVHKLRFTSSSENSN